MLQLDYRSSQRIGAREKSNGAYNLLELAKS